MLLEKTADSVIRGRVTAGAALLDRLFKDWYKYIDCNSLRLRRVDNCILSHIFGDYVTGLIELRKHASHRVSALDNGFTCGDITIEEGDGLERYDRIANSEWRNQVHKRINKRKTPFKIADDGFVVPDWAKFKAKYFPWC